MATPKTWPASLQQLLSEEGFGIRKGDTTIRSDMDVGPKKVRRRFTKSVDMFSGTIIVNIAQWEIFETFYNTTLAGGSLTFYFNHPITQVQTVFRFSEQPEYRSIGGGNFVVGMSWEKMPS